MLPPSFSLSLLGAPAPDRQFIPEYISFTVIISYNHLSKLCNHTNNVSVSVTHKHSIIWHPRALRSLSQKCFAIWYGFFLQFISLSKLRKKHCQWKFKWQKLFSISSFAIIYKITSCLLCMYVCMSRMHINQRWKTWKLGEAKKKRDKKVCL